MWKARLRRSRLWLLARRSLREFRDDHCQQMAAAISYHLLFSLFPLAIAAVGAIGLVTRDPNTRDDVVDAVLGVVPLSASGQDKLHTLLTSVSGGSGALGLLGVVGVLWSATGVMAAIRTSLNVAWDTDQRRPFVRGKLVDLLLVLGAVLAIGAALGLTIVTNVIRQGGEHLPAALSALTPLAGVVLTLVTLLIAVAVLFGTFLFFYSVVPAVPTRRREVWPGAAVSAIGLLVLQFGFSAYVAHIADYNRVYGPLGALVAFLFFVYLASAVFLLGAEVASEVPRLPPASVAAELTDADVTEL